MTLAAREWIFLRILIKNRLVDEAQVREWLHKWTEASSRIPLEEALLQKGWLSPEQLAKVQEAVERTLWLLEDMAYGQRAVEKGILSTEKLEKLYRLLQANKYRIRLGELLLLRGWIDDKTHRQLETQARKSLEQLLHTEQKADTALQKSKHKGETTPPKHRRRLRFGEMALHKLFVTSEQLEECLSLQKEMQKRGIRKKLGELMFEKSYINELQVQKIISAQEAGDDRIIENYTIEEKIGEGAMGVVFKAYLAGSSTPVALKVLRPYVAESRETLKRFIDEAKRALSLRHPNIVRAYEVGVSDDYYYYTMEYVEGKSVRELLEEQEVLPLEQAISIVLDIGRALEYAYKEGIVHRDIKPDNILVEEATGRAKLCDLGIAKKLHEDKSLTQEGIIMGTPYYISPELAKGEEIDIRSDLYSLGVTFYRMVTGRIPFDGSTATAVLMKHITTPPPPPRRFRADLPPKVERAILRLLRKKPEERFQTPREFVDYLSPFVTSDSTPPAENP